MSRKNDALLAPAVEPVATSLPAIDWASIGKSAPLPVAQAARQASDPLPKADVVVITWTSAEWSALDHVFANSGSARAPGLGAWDVDWFPYARKTGDFKSDPIGGPLWGSFRVVTVATLTGTVRVLLFHSDAHLQYEPYIAGLEAMVQNILADAKPLQLYSIGTAGGGALNQALGDTVVTNGAQLEAGKPPNNASSANGQTFTCTGWYPPTTLYSAAQKLMFPLSNVVTMPELQMLFSRFAQKYSVSSLKLTDFLNAPLQPANLGTPKVHSLKGLPLNTSCNFAMAPGTGSKTFAAFEEDDAAVAQAALKAGINFAFIRNVSDTVVPDHSTTGTVIPDPIREDWAGLLYDRYGLFTASNGALATWAAIAAG